MVSLIFSLFVLLLAGCSALTPQSIKQASIRATDQIAASNSVESHREVLTVPPLIVSVSNGNASVSIPQPSTASVKSESRNAANAMGDSTTVQSSTFTGGQKMILWGLGILLLTLSLWVAWKAIRNSAAGKAIEISDTALRQVLSNVESKLQTTTDKNKITELADLKAQLEKARGIINGQ